VHSYDLLGPLRREGQDVLKVLTVTTPAPSVVRRYHESMIANQKMLCADFHSLRLAFQYACLATDYRPMARIRDSRVLTVWLFAV
jgi:hypothetical protein